VSIYENIIFGLRVHDATGGQNRRQLDELVEASLTEVALWHDVKDRLHRRATGLTLEQQQKLCIARLLPLKPSVILMDEPCSALDAAGTTAIERLMEGLRGKYTIVIVTHNMAQARRTSDECIFMLLGELMEHGPTAEMFLRPKRSETEMYVEGRYG
jgi:phosphate transport system ATP-binding protein